MLRPDGNWVEILSINRVFGEAAVYNFEVENNHDYFVGSAGILVHNQTECGGSFFDGTRYTNKVLGDMAKSDLHSFPESVKAFESSGAVRSITGGDGVTRQMLEIPGGYKGFDNGVFQFMKEPNGDINHRFFKPF